MKSIVTTAIAVAFLGATGLSLAADETAPASTPATETAKPAATKAKHHHKHAAHKKTTATKAETPKQ